MMNKNILHSTPWNACVNIVLVMVLYSICRLLFIVGNMDIFGGTFSSTDVQNIFGGGLLFDFSAVCYTNILYLVLLLFPYHKKETPRYRKWVKTLFIVVNTFCLVLNLSDSVYFAYTKHRTTAAIFDQFGNEDNLLSIIGIEAVSHWYLFIVAGIFIYVLYKGYREYIPAHRTQKAYYGRQIISLALLTAVFIMGMRGASLWNKTRPIAMSDAFLYAPQPIHASAVLNTPFAILRTATGKPMETPVYFQNFSEVEALYSPIHIAKDSATVRKKNVVILIVESFAQEFIGSLNTHLDNGTYKGYTTFADSLLPHCLTWEQTFCNTGFSIDGMPAVLSSIPRMDKPFVLTPFALNDVNSLVKCLGDWGYNSAFFHGANRESLGLQAFAKRIGFDACYGREEYVADARFGGEKDYDGNWGIWDEPFLQYYCTKMNEMKQPFITTIFTLSSHHPFVLPKEYQDVFLEEGLYPLHKCIRYTDNALRLFFQKAAEQDWYKNTIFVLTADHASSRTTHDEYKTEVGAFRVPILFFDPSGELPVGKMAGVAQQIDIMPTLLHYLGYPKDFFAFGKDLLSDPAPWAMNWDRIPQYIWGDYVLQFDGREVMAVYNYKKDPLLKQNLKGKLPVEAEMTQHFKAFIQTYMERMKANKVKDTSPFNGSKNGEI